MRQILESQMLEEAKWDPQLVLPLRARPPEDPLLHWVAIWFAAKNLLTDADEHPHHWATKYDEFTEDVVTGIRDDAERQWRLGWNDRESSPNLDTIKATLKRFVGYTSFTPPEGL